MKEKTDNAKERDLDCCVLACSINENNIKTQRVLKEQSKGKGKGKQRFESRRQEEKQNRSMDT